MKSALVSLILPLLCLAGAMAQNWIWWEGEDAARHSFPERPAFAPHGKEKEKLSGGDWLQTDLGGDKGAYWNVQAVEAGTYDIWTRKFWKHGPFQWRFNQETWQSCGANCALADSVELRKHVVANWVYLGKAKLVKGKNIFEIKIATGAKAVAFDCFLATLEDFQPRGKLKPDTIEEPVDGIGDWVAFTPPTDTFSRDAAFDLRSLNQNRAGQEGFIIRNSDQLIFSNSRRPVRFWGVNLNVEFDRKASADHIARHLAKRGVNLVRLHTSITSPNFKQDAKVDPKTLDRIHYWIHALAQEGIYTKLSFYFPVWYRMPDSGHFSSYQTIENQNPFGLLFFEPVFQETYRSWAKKLLTTQNPYTGRSLVEDPALAIVEICNEDNLFFWTFKPHETIPSRLMSPLQQEFAGWTKRRYGSLEQGVNSWGQRDTTVKGDDLSKKELGLYPAAYLTSEPWATKARNQLRASDQAEFVHDLQESFYRETIKYFRQNLDLRCAISANNWITADDSNLGAINRHSALAGDLVDRHFYAGGNHQGPDSGFALRVGQTYNDYSSLFSPKYLPTNETNYNGYPNIISEFGAPAPNRFRAEAPVLAAAYGSLAGTDGILHFAHQGRPWDRSPSKFGLALPSLLGQFPACAFAFREGLIKPGPIVYSVDESLRNLYKLRGSPALTDQSEDKKGKIPPHARLIGQVKFNITPARSSLEVSKDLKKYFNPKQQTITSATQEIILNFKQGCLKINAPCAQGLCGFLNTKSQNTTRDLSLTTNNEYLSILAVALDKKPLRSSLKILVQVVTEDQPNAWGSRSNGQSKTITAVGQSPILLKKIDAQMQLRHDLAHLYQVTPLDANGMRMPPIKPSTKVQDRLSFKLLPSTLYYLIEPKR